MDITDRSLVDALVSSFRPHVVINAAAYTAVDRAEDEPELATLVNDTAVGHLATAADSVGAALIHISTDYVFDGTKPGWYTEHDATNPTGVYGATKLAGETKALSAGRAVVLRTAWVYGVTGANFVKTMRRLAGERDELGVVHDQIGCPTAAVDIAKAIRNIVGAGIPETGLFHLASPDQASWWDLAKETISLAGHRKVTINKLASGLPDPCGSPGQLPPGLLPHRAVLRDPPPSVARRLGRSVRRTRSPRNGNSRAAEDRSITPGDIVKGIVLAGGTGSRLHPLTLARRSSCCRSTTSR